MEPPADPPGVNKAVQLQRKIQHALDKTTIWVKTRWAMFVLVLVAYSVRVYLKQGFYIVTYGLGIYLLNLLIGFLSPAVDPDADGALPMTNEEYRPFVRKLPEFKFWVAAFRSVVSCFIMTFFQMFDLPVFWPILLAYFVLLVVLTMKDRVKHMLKHKYVPFSSGKQTYGDLTKMQPGADGGKGKKEAK